MSIWFTSDNHFGHKNVIRYCARPFESVEQMDERMEAGWNSVVAPEDDVYYLGDFALKPRVVPEILSRLHGTKILIAGNHDKCHPNFGRSGAASKWKEHYLRAGFASIQTQMQIEIAGQLVWLCHLPYRNEADPEQRFFSQRLVDEGQWLLHGHVHERWKVKGRQINVGVDVWDFKPVSLETIAAIIEQGPVSCPRA